MPEGSRRCPHLVSSRDRFRLEGRFRLTVIEASKSSRNTEKSSLAIQAAGPATPLKPSKPARMTMIKNARGQLDIANSLLGREVSLPVTRAHFHGERGVHGPFDHDGSAAPCCGHAFDLQCVHEVSVIPLLGSPSPKLKLSQAEPAGRQIMESQCLAAARCHERVHTACGRLAFCNAPPSPPLQFAVQANRLLLRQRGRCVRACDLQPRWNSRAIPLLRPCSSCITHPSAGLPPVAWGPNLWQLEKSTKTTNAISIHTDGL
jgi:hypothetical protein